MPLRLYNTLTRRKEPFSRTRGRVRRVLRDSIEFPYTEAGIGLARDSSSFIGRQGRAGARRIVAEGASGM